ncbi:MAG: DNA polymerase III subunit delta' [Desulfobacterales bacterium]|nr:DNA polymerase III subunit delta' [Desulfobacterales bacterium]
MIKTEQIIDQDRPVRILSTLIQNSAVPHALLFSGIEGIGKRTCAMLFAMACNCGDLHSKKNTGETRSGQVPNNIFSPCGNCKSCKRILSENHPDIIQVNPSGPIIRIAQIRELLETISMRPYEAQMRVVIISEAHTMNPESANALLKSLEEPPDRTIFILTTGQPTNLLPTILSRCQHIRFNPLSNQGVEHLLINNIKIEPPIAKTVAILAKGSYIKAVTMTTDKWLRKRNWLLNEIDTLAEKPKNQILALAESLASNKEALPDILLLLTTWFRDQLVYQSDPEKILNKDLTNRIQYVSQRTTDKHLHSRIKAVQEMQNKLKYNVNLRLAMESLMMNLAGI